MDQGQNPPTPEKDQPTSAQELPQPHDMLLNPTPKSGGQLRPPTFWEKYGSKKWLLPLLIFVVVLAVAAGTYYVAGAKSNNANSARQDRKLLKSQRKQNKNKANKKNKADKKNKKGKSVAIAQPGWTSFSYGNGANTITMQYPQDMKVNITNGLSTVDNKTQVTVISFTGTNPMKMTLEPNPTALSVTAWHDQLAKQNKLYASAAETTQFAGKESLLQNTLGTTPAWNAFIPMNGTILFASMTYTGDSKTARNDFLAILDTLQFGKTNKTKLPSVRVLPSNPAI